MKTGTFKNILHWFTPADKLLIFALIALSLFSFALIRYFTETGSWVVIWVEGQPFARLALAHERLLTVEGPLGKTVVRIREQRVEIQNSACPNKICQKMGSIQRVGQMLVCVPNRVVIKIEGESKTISLDVITE